MKGEELKGEGAHNSDRKHIGVSRDALETKNRRRRVSGSGGRDELDGDAAEGSNSNR